MQRKGVVRREILVDVVSMEVDLEGDLVEDLEAAMLSSCTPSSCWQSSSCSPVKRLVVLEAVLEALVVWVVVLEVLEALGGWEGLVLVADWEALVVWEVSVDLEA